MITKAVAKIELAKRELAKRKLEYFTTYVDPFSGHPKKGYLFKPFHKQITDGLERILSGEIKKLMISVPPQHGKSTISSQRFPLFAHLKDSSLDIALASYSQDLSRSHLSKIRQLVDSDKLKNLGDINLLSNTSTSYELKEGGTFNAVGVGGSLTGKPVDLGIIDDVHKDRQEYESLTIRNSVWDWYTSVFLSRLHKDSAQVLVMTRWGEDDLFGKIMELEGDQWEIINIPVEFEDTTIFPEKFPLDFIQSKRKVMGERDYQSLYMGDPVNEGGGAFLKEYFEYYNSSEQVCVMRRLNIISFLDPAISKKQEADFTGLVTIGVDPNSNLIYVLEVKKLKEEPDRIIDEVFTTTDKFKHLGSSYRLGIEIVAYQKMLALEIKKQMRLRDKFFVMEEVNPQGEKEARIKSILQPRYSNRSILHSKETENIGALETELLKFPNGKHDDLIDSFASAMRLSEVNNLGDEEEYYFDDNTEVADLDGIL